ncbi:hypothetical protein Q7P37_003431 [Cladosporium fusiforme]
MAGHANQSANGLEDQVRNMILSGPSSHHPAAQQPARPNVHLPPSATQYPAAQNQYSHGFNARAQTNPQLPAQQHPQPQHPPHDRGYGSNRYRQPQPAQAHIYAPNGSQHRPNYQQQGHHQGFPNRGRGRPFPQAQQSRQNHQQYQSVDPNTFGRGGRAGYGPPQQQPHQLYQPADRAPLRGMIQPHQYAAQSQYLDSIAAREIPTLEMSQSERDAKDTFRKELEKICQEVCAKDPERLPKVSIEGFGSFSSGFASASSDMDLVLVVQGTDPTAACFSPMEDDLPRSLERRLLDMGYGARLLTRTRVPIIKICQAPSPSLLSKLREEREKWDFLDRDKKYPHLRSNDDDHEEDDIVVGPEPISTSDTAAELAEGKSSAETVAEPPAPPGNDAPSAATTTADITPASIDTETKASTDTTKAEDATQKPQRDTWTRERTAGPLDFPDSGVGIQTDINFFNPLGIHNTQMLRCYSLCDPRVRPMILFVKSWVKRRKINSSYSGTLSSYGYVLMTLHYLINVANPPVLPNLQQPWRPHDRCTKQGVDRAEIEGWGVDFWRREDEIQEAARHGVLTRNQESIGALLAGFFQYYSSQGGQPSFHWMGRVLSLRSPGGTLTKEEKGWVKAVTEQGAGKQVQHRYLFCIEDPFEQSHNVARTVTHKGIVAIRDEFRRAHRILRAIGNGYPPADGELFDLLVEDTTQDLSKVDWNPGTTGQQNQQPDPHRQPHAPRQAQKSTQPKPLNVTDTDAFPSLGAPKPKQTSRSAKPAGAKKKQDLDEAGSISGDKAKAYLEELKRQKADEAAQTTASDVAEKSLGS